MNSFFMSLLLAGPAPEGGEQNPIMAFLPIVLIIGIFYFLILRPQNKKQKETQRMIQALKKGDRVVTIGGIHGVIQTVKENSLILKVDENVKLEFTRSAISSVISQARDDKEDKEDKKAIEDNEDSKDDTSDSAD